MKIKIAAILLLLAASSPAFAGSTTFQATPGSGGPFRFGTDGSSNLFGNGAICDGAACAVLAAVKAASTAAVAADPALVVTISPNNTANVLVTNTNANGSATSANSSPVVIASDQGVIPVAPTPYPATAVPITASATGTTGATTATLTNVSGHKTYICGFSIRANATAAATGNSTVTGVITGTMNFTQWTAPTASGIGVTEETFSPCIPASAVNISIAVVSAAPGTGGVVSVSAWGYSI